MSTSSIGPYTFASMTPQPQTKGWRLQPETKAGVNGVGFWALGIHGQEYQVTTTAIAATFAAAVAAEALYRALINAGPVAVVYGDQAIGSAIVLDVQAAAERVLMAQPGNGEAMVKANWKLIPV